MGKLNTPPCHRRLCQGRRVAAECYSVHHLCPCLQPGLGAAEVQHGTPVSSHSGLSSFILMMANHTSRSEGACNVPSIGGLQNRQALRQDVQHGSLVKQSITLACKNDTSAEKVPAWSAAFMLPATARAVGTRRCLPNAELVCPACCAFA